MRNASGELHPATWDEALDRIADEIKAVQVSYGYDATAIFGSGDLTNEKGYLLGKFARIGLTNRGSDSTYKPGGTVQTTGNTSTVSAEHANKVSASTRLW